MGRCARAALVMVILAAAAQKTGVLCKSFRFARSLEGTYRADTQVSFLERVAYSLAEANREAAGPNRLPLTGDVERRHPLPSQPPVS